MVKVLFRFPNPATKPPEERVKFVHAYAGEALYLASTGITRKASAATSVGQGKKRLSRRRRQGERERGLLCRKSIALPPPPPVCLRVSGGKRGGGRLERGCMQ